MHKVRPGVYSWEAYPKQSHETFKMEQYYTVFTGRYKLIQRCKHVRKNQESETLHSQRDCLGILKVNIFRNYT